MMTRILLSLLTCGIIFAGCNNKTEKKESTDQVPQVTDQVTADTATIQAPAEATPGTTAPMTMTAAPGQPAGTTAAGMNPPHGEPGHRCDIAVGAPLNSPPGNTQKTTLPGSPDITTAPPPVMSAPQPGPGPSISNLPSSTPVNASPAGSSTATAPGMNPPHGQPGHDCSIPVGSPLKK